VSGRSREDAARLLLQEEIRRLKARVKALEEKAGPLEALAVRLADAEIARLAKGKKR
jgi:hypothetical protein